MLALDVDGTLAWRRDEVLPRTRQALERARERGVDVVIATGRRYRTTLRVVEALGFPVPAVCLGGALVKDPAGATLHQQGLEAEAFREVAGLLREFGQSAVAQRDGHGPEVGADLLLDGALPWNRWTAQYAERNRDFAEWRPDLGRELRRDVLLVGAFGSVEELARVEGELHRRHPGRFQSHLMPLPAEEGSGRYLEVAPFGVCKWQGLRRLAERLGIGPEAICAVGDERNDLSMVRAAGLGVAMGNGHTELRRVADWVTGRHDEDGLVAVVERILEGS